MSSAATIENEVGVPGDVSRAVVPFDPLVGVVSGRVCESCGGPVWWKRERFACANCGGSEYRIRDLVGSDGRAPESRVSEPLTEPEWTGGFRGRVAKLLWDRGLKRKAVRFLNCNKLARPGVCSHYPFEHKYFVPNGCEVVFCKECADKSRRELLMDYWRVVCNAILDFAGERREHERLCELLGKSEGLERKGIECRLDELWARVGRCLREKGLVLWRVNFTLRSDGSEITPEKVKAMNACIRTVMRRSVRLPFAATNRSFSASGGESTRSERVGAGHESETALSPLKCFGLLFVDEVGFELRGHLPDAQRVAHGLNLHAHGLYFGPGLDWERTRDLWVEVTKKKIGVESRGFFYKPVKKFAENPGRAIRWALNHMFKYVSKPPAVTPERLASLIAAFNTAKRVHSLGLFYGKKPKREKKDCPCPKCRAMGIVSAISFEGSALPDGGCIPRLEKIEELLARGYVPLREAGRDAVLAMGESREDSWGASP